MQQAKPYSILTEILKTINALYKDPQTRDLIAAVINIHA